VMRTQKRDDSLAHLKNSRETFLLLLDKVRSMDRKLAGDLTANRDYEGLDAYILRHLLGAKA